MWILTHLKDLRLQEIATIIQSLEEDTVLPLLEAAWSFSEDSTGNTSTIFITSMFLNYLLKEITDNKKLLWNMQENMSWQINMSKLLVESKFPSTDLWLHATLPTKLSLKNISRLSNNSIMKNNFLKHFHFLTNVSYSSYRGKWIYNRSRFEKNNECIWRSFKWIGI